MDQDELSLRNAIATISQSDPLIKLLQQVASGRMKPTDPGLRAVTDSWLTTYRNTIESTQFSKWALRRMDPSPRVALLVETGILDPAHPPAVALLGDYERLLRQAAS